MSQTIKSMQLYPRADRIFADLRAEGFDADDPVPVDVLNRYDQLHYHGTDALDAAIARAGIDADHHVLEVGSGWGGCARYIAQTTGAHVTAVELQQDYNDVARTLTDRAGLSASITHLNADFLSADLPKDGFDHAVSWLALFHIPDRPAYLSKLHRLIKAGGLLCAEDLYLIKSPPEAEAEEFRAHLFPNSLVSLDAYKTGLKDAGFADLALADMTQDWSAFTAERLETFRTSRAEYENVHGSRTYQQIELFYSKMAGYFSRGLVGGLRMSARKDR
ncbi:MAG: methyltransferase domain-containing protein [Pseudomonadota bacterium]